MATPAVKSNHIAERMLMIGIIILLLISNILSITNNTFHEKLYGLLTHIPYQNLLHNSPLKKLNNLKIENEKLKIERTKLIYKREQQSKIVRYFSKSIISRIKINVSKNVASIAPQILPGIGDALMITITTMDVIDGCNNIREIKEILRNLEVEPIVDYEDEVCGMKIPTLD